MRMTLFAALGILLGQAPAPGDPEPGRVVDKVGGFSWVPPKGWKVYDPAAKKSAVPRSNQAWGSAAKGPGRNTHSPSRPMLANRTAWPICFWDMVIST